MYVTDYTHLGKTWTRASRPQISEASANEDLNKKRRVIPLADRDLDPKLKPCEIKKKARSVHVKLS